MEHWEILPVLEEMSFLSVREPDGPTACFNHFNEFVTVLYNSVLCSMRASLLPRQDFDVRPHDNIRPSLWYVVLGDTSNVPLSPHIV